MRSFSFHSWFRFLRSFNFKMFKKTIAREGLIILVWVATFLVVGIPTGFNNVGLITTIFCAYPVYLIVSFVIWAIKTLRE